MQDYEQQIVSHAMPPASNQPTHRSRLLSMPPRRRSQQYMQSQEPGMDYVQPSMSQHILPARIKNYNASKILTAQQPRSRTQGAAFNSPGLRVHQPTSASQVPSTPSFRRPLGPIAAPSASPLFGGRSGSQRSVPIPRLPARVSPMQYQQEPVTRNGTMGRQHNSMPRASVQPTLQGMSTPAPSAFGSQSHARSSIQPSQDRYVGQQYREPPFGSQPPPMSDGVFQRPAVPQRQSLGEPMSEAQHGRLTLPPSRSRDPFFNSQDSRLSMIPGARGAGASQHMYGRQSLASAANASRYLSSAVGARRPVQR